MLRLFGRSIRPALPAGYARHTGYRGYGGRSIFVQDKKRNGLGTDIYTVSKMLTHKNVSTTQIYTDLVNAKKRESANKISLK